jgi:long-chain acyl-CoA synthetase
MSYPTTIKLFLDAIDRSPKSPAQMRRTSNGWQTISGAEMLQSVAGLAKALRALGVKSGDRVALLAPNCPEWHIADFAIQGIGAITVPLYFNESQERIAYILKDSGAKIVFLAGEAQIQNFLACPDRPSTVEQIIAVNPPDEFAHDVLRYETLISTAGDAEVTEYRREAEKVTPDQLATLIYTSGTTGEPKGVMLSHANLTSNATDALSSHMLTPGDLALSFLPLSHVYERTVDYTYIFHGVPIAYVDRMENVQQALLEVHPTRTAAVPRFFEKIYAGICEKGRQATGWRRRAFDWAMRVAHEAVPWRAYNKPASLSLKFRWWLADKLVFTKIRTGLGGNIRAICSGGAALSLQLGEFYASINVPVYQGYGLTETSPVVATNGPRAQKIGTVGPPIPNVDVRIAEDGEIQVRGRCVMQGYWHKPEQTRETMTPDGWLRTGDIGHLDSDGYLSVTDRKKELLKTAAGKLVAPQPIENKLRTSPFISNALLFGDKRKFLSVLIVPNFSALESKLGGHGVAFVSHIEAVADPRVRKIIEEEVDRLTSNLAQYEKPKRFALIEDDFTAANGQLTHTLKPKRRIIEERYRDVITRLYADVEGPKPQAIS